MLELLPPGIHCVRLNGSLIWRDVCRRCLTKGGAVAWRLNTPVDAQQLCWLADREVNARSSADKNMAQRACRARRRQPSRRWMLVRRSRILRRPMWCAPTPGLRNRVVVDITGSFQDGSIIDLTWTCTVKVLDCDEKD